MPKSSDPARHGGEYIVQWIDENGTVHVTRRPTKGQAQKLMKHRKSQGYTAWIDPIK